jgi:hypothetical protein
LHYLLAKGIEMISVAARIVLRYLAGALVAIGMLDAPLAAQIAVDPDLLTLIGAGIGIAVECAYAFAKRMGWST